MDDMEKLSSIMNRTGIPKGEASGCHQRIVDADAIAADDDLPGVVELPGDEVPGALVPTVPSTPRPAFPCKQPVVEQALPPLPLAAIPAPVSQKSMCSICKGAGYLRQNVPYGHPEFGKLKKCQCKIRQQAQELFGGAHIPDDFKTCSFESYLRLPLSTDQRQSAMLVQAFVLPRLEDGYAGRKRGLYLHGSWGVGKTGLAVSALRQAIEAGKSGLYLPTTDLFDILYEAIA